MCVDKVFLLEQKNFQKNNYQGFLPVLFRYPFIIPPFAELIRSIRIQDYLKKGTMENKIPKKSSQIKPCIGLYLPPTEEIPKTELVEFPCRITAGPPVGARGATNSQPMYRTTVRRFNEGSPEQWIAVLTAISEIWAQNQVTTASDRLATVRAILREQSLAQFEASLITQQGHPAVPITNDMITAGLLEVAENVFPHRALEMQKLWMKRGLKKPRDMTFRALSSAVNRMNNALPHFPGATDANKFSEVDLIEVLEWAIPAAWRAKFDLDGYVPTLHPRERLLKACAAIERNQDVPTTEKHGTSTKGKELPKKKGNFKVKHPAPSGHHKKASHYCTHHGPNHTHNTDACFTLKSQGKEGSSGKKSQAFGKKLFKKELHLLSKDPAEKAKVLEAYSAIIAKEQQKLVKASTTDSDDESIQVIDVIPAPPKEKKSKEDKDEASTYSGKIAKEFNAKLKLAWQKKKLKDYTDRLAKLGHSAKEPEEDEISFMSVGSQLTEAAEWELID